MKCDRCTRATNEDPQLYQTEPQTTIERLIVLGGYNGKSIYLNIGKPVRGIGHHVVIISKGN